MVLEILYLLAISCLWVYSRQKAKKVAEYDKMIRYAAVRVDELEGLIRGKDRQIEELKKNAEECQKLEEYQKRLRDNAKKVEDLNSELLYYISRSARLNCELKKRTEQYNDLVDLAREKGIIGE